MSVDDGAPIMGEDARVAEHLRNHLTDGYWHDSCPYCRRRRVFGGNGTEPRSAAA